jgi:arylsulfatase A-like enzyme
MCEAVVTGNMKIFRTAYIFCILIAVLLSGCSQEMATPVSDSPGSAKPNILLIVADDLGYSDIGAFGSEISTPHIDALANEGVMLTQFHVFPNCGPTRGAMLTGVDPHRAGLASNHGGAAENQKGKPGYEGHLRQDVVTIAQVLREAGYNTYMAGKWHLGDGNNDPAARGFEKSFALLNGAASHWADQAPIIPGSATRYTRDGQPVDQLPADFYSTTWYTDQVISYIDSAGEDGAPFFAFLSFTAGHNPLHVPRQFIDKYRGRFDQGWDALAQERLGRLKQLGLASDGQRSHPRPDWIMAWDELSPKQQAERARDMEIYAGMIDFMDESIGRLLEHLKKSGEYDNTLIVFLSDNGPSKTSITDYLALGGEVEKFVKQFDNSLGNRGLPGSSTDIGPGWAFAAATPLRLFKGYVAQGGIQVPSIFKLPGDMPNAGSRTAQLAHVMDLMPTFLEVAGANYPQTYGGVNVVPMQGISLIPLLRGETQTQKVPRRLGWTAYGMDAFREGDWKVLRLPEPFGNGNWQLYNLVEDPGEMSDLSSRFPDRTQELASGWNAYAQTNGVIVPSTPTFYAKPISGRKY